MSPKTPRPAAAPGYTIQRRSHCGKIFVTVTTMKGKPFEVFIRFGKAGGETTVYASDAGGNVIWSANVRVGSNIDSVDQMLALAAAGSARIMEIQRQALAGWYQGRA